MFCGISDFLRQRRVRGVEKHPLVFLFLSSIHPFQRQEAGAGGIRKKKSEGKNRLWTTYNIQASHTLYILEYVHYILYSYPDQPVNYVLFCQNSIHIYMNKVRIPSSDPSFHVYGIVHQLFQHVCLAFDMSCTDASPNASGFMQPPPQNTKLILQTHVFSTDSSTEKRKKKEKKFLRQGA